MFDLPRRLPLARLAWMILGLGASASTLLTALIMSREGPRWLVVFLPGLASALALASWSTRGTTYGSAYARTITSGVLQALVPGMLEPFTAPADVLRESGGPVVFALCGMLAAIGWVFVPLVGVAARKEQPHEGFDAILVAGGIWLLGLAFVHHWLGDVLTGAGARLVAMTATWVVPLIAGLVSLGAYARRVLARHRFLVAVGRGAMPGYHFERHGRGRVLMRVPDVLAADYRTPARRAPEAVVFLR